MQAVVRGASRRLMPAIKPAFIQRATLVSGPPRYPMSFAVSIATCLTLLDLAVIHVTSIKLTLAHSQAVMK